MEHHKKPLDIIATARSRDANRTQRILVQLADGAPAIEIEPFCTRPSLCRVIPQYAARMYCVVAVSESDGVPTVAVSDPHDLDALKWLRRYLGEPVRIVVAPESQIRRAIVELYWSVEPPAWQFQCLEVTTPTETLTFAINLHSGIENRLVACTSSENCCAVIARMSDEYRSLQKEQLLSGKEYPDPTIPHLPLEIHVEGFADCITVSHREVYYLSHAGPVFELFVRQPPSQLEWLVGARINVVRSARRT